MQLYITGKNIDNIRFTCKNQYIDFTDWTEKRPNFSMEKQFTVSYVSNPQKGISQQEKKNEDNKPQIQTSKYSKPEVEEAKVIAQKYYSGFSGDREIVSIEYTENSPLLSSGVADEYKEWQIIAFKTYEKSMYSNTARTILLARDSSKNNWIVINEGY